MGPHCERRRVGFTEDVEHHLPDCFISYSSQAAFAAAVQHDMTTHGVGTFIAVISLRAGIGGLLIAASLLAGLFVWSSMGAE
jgi:hypothetical protein